MRFIVGSRMSHLRHAILSAPWFPLTRYIAKGSYALYDIQCFSGTRHFNVIFDVGANVGQTAHGLISYFPVSQIYCFEPATAPFEEIVPSALIETGPGNIAMIPLSPITASPDWVINCPVAET